MNAFWGDEFLETGRPQAFSRRQIFGTARREKAPNEVIAEAFRKSLKGVAGFSNVPKPIAMRNTQNSIVYYLFFALQKPVAEEIVHDIFKKYRERGGTNGPILHRMTESTWNPLTGCTKISPG